MTSERPITLASGPTAQAWVPKPWGGEQIVVNSPLYCLKILHVQRGRAGSLHFHRVKTETFYVEEGEVLLRYVLRDDAEAFVGGDFDVRLELTRCTTLRRGDSFHVPTGMLHQVHGVLPSRIVEVSTHDSPEDSIRVVPGY